MKDPKDPKNPTEIKDDKITNADEQVVNKENTTEPESKQEHEPTNEEQWVHDGNEQFGDDLILPDEPDEDDVKY